MSIDEQQVIPEAEQKGTDFDWFAVDGGGCIGHFTSAGFKLLPKSVSSSALNLRRVTDYFEQLAPTGSGHQVSPELERETGPFESEETRQRYLSSFSEMANRGLYSFDIHTYLKPGLAYFRVASPVKPLRLDSLPKDIQAIVQRTQFNGIRFGKVTHIDYETTVGS